MIIGEQSSRKWTARCRPSTSGTRRTRRTWRASRAACRCLSGAGTDDKRRSLTASTTPSTPSLSSTRDTPSATYRFATRPLWIHTCTTYFQANSRVQYKLSSVQHIYFAFISIIIKLISFDKEIVCFLDQSAIYRSVLDLRHLFLQCVQLFRSRRTHDGIPKSSYVVSSS